MNPADFDMLSQLVRERAGLVLTKDKHYLFESRLIPLARKRGLGGLDDLIAAVRAGADEVLLTDITEAMMTNESSFFRDTSPFEHFKTMVLPELMERRASTRTIRIWSAACSTGQEPYSISMCLRDLSDVLSGWRVDIVATDLSGVVLEKAKVGMYTQFEIQRGLPIQYLMSYFHQVDEMWHIDSSLRAMVKFHQYNLLNDVSALGQFDIVFCRNVLIYFDLTTKADVLRRISNQMPSDGYLFLGGAETVLGITTDFEALKKHRGVYVLSDPSNQASIGF